LAVATPAARAADTTAVSGIPYVRCPLQRNLARECDAFDAAEAADDQCLVARSHVEGFQAWMVDTRSASAELRSIQAAGGARGATDGDGCR
jgi:hypothetical protein